MNLIPPELSQTAGQIGAMSEQARKTLVEMHDSNVIPDLDLAIKKIGTQMDKVGDTLTSVQTVLNDPNVIQNIRESVANIHTASEKLNTLVDSLQQNSKDFGSAMADTRQHVDDLSKLLGDRLIQLSSTMDNIQSITDKLNKGNGSAGAAINDPRLYQSLVDSARELDATATDLHRLIDQWEQEGVSLHLK
jgi:phospholipid/cholesterol/gamma-HCH transport system substrate-binding protein